METRVHNAMNRLSVFSACRRNQGFTLTRLERTDVFVGISFGPFLAPRDLHNPLQEPISYVCQSLPDTPLRSPLVPSLASKNFSPRSQAAPPFQVSPARQHMYLYMRCELNGIIHGTPKYDTSEHVDWNFRFSKL